MPKDRAGSVIWNKSRTLASARVRVPGIPGKPAFPMPSSSASQAQAQTRCDVVNEVAQRMVSLDAALAKNLLTRIAAAPSGKLAAACAGADEYIGGYRPPSGVPTIQTFGKSWTSGELRAAHRADVREMTQRTADATDELFAKWVYPVIGHQPLDAPLDVFDLVKVKLSKSELEHNSMRNVLARLRALMNLAVYPGKHITASPLPKGWVPAPEDVKAKAMIYPDDDAQLLACTAISIHWRMFWGFFGHEGMRPHNIVTLRLSNVDLDRNSVTVDESKTDTPILFAMTVGTREALREYLRRYRPNAKQTDHLFIDDDGGPIPLARIAQVAREHFALAGIFARRPDLAAETDARRHLVAYDYRGAFITVKLAARWTPYEIQAHTAHVDTRMFEVYKRAAKTFEQLDLTARDFVPLIAAIPELQGSKDGDDFEPGKGGPIGHGLANRSANHAISLVQNKFSQDFVLGFQLPDMPKTPKNVHPIKQSSPADTDANGHTAANPERLDMHAMVQRLGYELAVERGVSQRMAEALATVHQGLELQLAATVSAATVAAVIGELQRKGMINRPKPELVQVKADDEPEPEPAVDP